MRTLISALWLAVLVSYSYNTARSAVDAACISHPLIEDVHISKPTNGSYTKRLISIEVAGKVNDLQKYQNDKANYMICIAIRYSGSPNWNSECGLEVDVIQSVAVRKHVPTELSVAICPRSEMSAVASGQSVSCICQDSVHLEPNYLPRCLEDERHTQLFVGRPAEQNKALFSRPDDRQFEIFVSLRLPVLDGNSGLSSNSIRPEDAASILSLLDAADNLAASWQQDGSYQKGVLALTLNIVVTIESNANREQLGPLVAWLEAVTKHRSSGLVVPFAVYICPEGITNCLLPTMLDQHERFRDETIIVSADTSTIVYEPEFLLEAEDALMRGSPCFVIPHTELETTHVMMSAATSRLHHYTIDSSRRTVRWSEITSPELLPHYPFVGENTAFVTTYHALRYFADKIPEGAPYDTWHLMDATRTADLPNPAAVFVWPWPSGAVDLYDHATFVASAKIKSSRMTRFETILKSAGLLVAPAV